MWYVCMYMYTYVHNDNVCIYNMISIKLLVILHNNNIQPSERTGVIYQIPCVDYDKSYVGQTGITLSQRLKEHQRAVTILNIYTNALVEHVLT